MAPVVAGTEVTMRPLARLTAGVLGAMVLTACASANISSFVERGIDLRQYRTYRPRGMGRVS